MAIRNIRYYDDPILRKRCKEVKVMENLLLSCNLYRRKREKLSSFIFSDIIRNKKSVNYMDVAEVQYGITYTVPCFLFAMYEKHGQPLEVVVKNIIQTKFIAPKERPYRTDNFYSVLERQRKLEKEVSAIAKGNTKKQRGGKRKG